MARSASAATPGTKRRARARPQRATKTRAERAAEISGIFRQTIKQTVAGIMDTGARLIAAKEALAHGEFVKMIARELPFGASTAQRFMKISRTPHMQKAAHGQLLPAAWRTLIELAKLSIQEFEAALSGGAIHPNMRRGDIAPYRTAKPQYLTVPVVSYSKHVTAVGYIRAAEPAPARNVVPIGGWRKRDAPAIDPDAQPDDDGREDVGNAPLEVLNPQSGPGAGEIDDVRARLIEILLALPREQRMREVERIAAAADLDIPAWPPVLGSGNECEQ